MPHISVACEKPFPAGDLDANARMNKDAVMKTKITMDKFYKVNEKSNSRRKFMDKIQADIEVQVSRQRARAADVQRVLNHSVAAQRISEPQSPPLREV